MPRGDHFTAPSKLQPFQREPAGSRASMGAIIPGIPGMHSICQPPDRVPGLNTGGWPGKKEKALQTGESAALSGWPSRVVFCPTGKAEAGEPGRDAGQLGDAPGGDFVLLNKAADFGAPRRKADGLKWFRVCSVQLQVPSGSDRLG